MTVSLGFSLLLGLWIYRIIEQSESRASLIASLEAARAELAAAHHAQGVAAERERIAREIHDTLAQGFTSIVMLAQASPVQPALIEQVARDNLAEARALVAAFSPLDSSTLTEALDRLTTRFRDETGLAVEVDLSGSPALSRDREVVLLRVVQEALTNVRRHARASSVTVRLQADPAGARVEVVDDGVGFGPDRREGYGLAGIRGRVDEAGGSVDVASAPGRGTHLTVRVPA